MPYATEADMVDRYGADTVVVVSDRDHDGVADTGVVGVALADATSLIDSFLASRYDLPLAEVPEMIERCCVDIAMYQMAADAAVATEEQRKRFEDCMAMLKMMAKGEVSLAVEEPPAQATASSSAWFQSAARKFNRDLMRGR